MYFLLTLILDQIIKYIVVTSNCNVQIIPEIFNLMFVKNTGGIYGSFEDNNFIFSIVSIIVLIVLFIYSKNITKDNKFKQIVWQIIFAGGVSNLIDRILRGFVVDFVQMIGFGVFNLSDICIILGAIIIIFLELRESFSGNNRKSNN